VYIFSPSEGKTLIRGERDPSTELKRAKELVCDGSNAGLRVGSIDGEYRYSKYSHRNKKEKWKIE